jgi:hypothetical protein
VHKKDVDALRALGSAYAQIIREFGSAVLPPPDLEDDARLAKRYNALYAAYLFLLFEAVAWSGFAGMPMSTVAMHALFILALLVHALSWCRAHLRAMDEQGEVVLGHPDMPSPFAVLRSHAEAVGMTVPLMRMVYDRGVRNASAAWAPGLPPIVSVQHALWTQHPEIMPAVIAHELGHVRNGCGRRAFWREFLREIVTMAALLNAFAWFLLTLDGLSHGTSVPPTAYVVFATCLAAYAAGAWRRTRRTTMCNHLSEYAADAFAIKMVGAMQVIVMLQLIADGFRNPDVAIDEPTMTHPSITRRIEVARLHLPPPRLVE